MDFQGVLHWIVLAFGCVSFTYVAWYGAWHHWRQRKLALSRAIALSEASQAVCMLVVIGFSTFAAVWSVQLLPEWIQSIMRIGMYAVPAWTTFLMRRISNPIIGCVNDVVE